MEPTGVEPRRSALLIQTATPRPLEEARRVWSGGRSPEGRASLEQPRGVSSTETVLQPVLELLNAATEERETSEKGEEAQRERTASPHLLTPSPCCENCVKGLLAWTGPGRKSWQMKGIYHSLAVSCRSSWKAQQTGSALAGPVALTFNLITVRSRLPRSESSPVSFTVGLIYLQIQFEFIQTFSKVIILFSTVKTS